MRSRKLVFVCLVALTTIGTVFPVCAKDQPSPSRETVLRDLDEIGRVASIMLDGDLCRRIVTERALKSLFTRDARDPWAASDNFDVNHEAYIAVKKSLIRLSRLVSYPCDVNLWTPIEGAPDKVMVLIRNANEWSQFWTWGQLTQDLPAEMSRVLKTGKREAVTRRPGMISVLAPVYDSLGDIAALVEVVAYEPAFRPPQVHAKVLGGAQMANNLTGELE